MSHGLLRQPPMDQRHASSNMLPLLQRTNRATAQQLTPLQRAFRAQWRRGSKPASGASSPVNGKSVQGCPHIQKSVSLPTLAATFNNGHGPASDRKPVVWNEGKNFPAIHKASTRPFVSEARAAYPKAALAKLPKLLPLQKSVQATGDLDWSEFVADTLRPPREELARTATLKPLTPIGGLLSGRPAPAPLELTNGTGESTPTPVGVTFTEQVTITPIGRRSSSRTSFASDRSPFAGGRSPQRKVSVAPGTVPLPRSSVLPGEAMQVLQESIEEDPAEDSKLSTVELMLEPTDALKERVQDIVKHIGDSGLLGKDLASKLMCELGHREVRVSWCAEIAEAATQSFHMDIDDTMGFVEEYRLRFSREVESSLGATISKEAAPGSVMCSNEAADTFLGSIEVGILPGVCAEVKQSLGINTSWRGMAPPVCIEDILHVRDIVIDNGGFTPSENTRLRKIFGLYDRDGDGFLSQKEISLALTWAGCTVEHSRQTSQRAKDRTSEEDFVMIVKRFQQTEEGHIRVAFEKAEFRKDGKIQVADLPLFFERLGHLWATPELIAEAQGLCEIPTGDALAFNDVYHIFTRCRGTQGFLVSELEELELAFSEFDVNNSATLDAAELEIVMPWLGYPATWANIREILMEYDMHDAGELEMDQFRGFVARFRDTLFRRAKRIFIRYASIALKHDVGLAKGEAWSALLELGFSVTKATVDRWLLKCEEPLLFWDFLNLVTAGRREMCDRARRNECFTDSEVMRFKLEFNKRAGSEGVLQNEQLVAFLEELYPDIRLSADVHLRAKKLLEASDSDSDGRIDFDEFLHMMRLNRHEMRVEELQKEKETIAKTSFSASEVEEFRQSFNLYDEDFSGTLSADVLGQLLVKIGPALKLGKDELLQKMLVISRDGSRKVNFGDFLSLMQELVDQSS